MGHVHQNVSSSCMANGYSGAPCTSCENGAIPVTSQRILDRDGSMEASTSEVAQHRTLRCVLRTIDGRILLSPQHLAYRSANARDASWKKSSLYVLRTDGKSCSRELVTGGCKADHPCWSLPQTPIHLLRSNMLIPPTERQGQAHLCLSEHPAAHAGLEESAQEVRASLPQQAAPPGMHGWRKASMPCKTSSSLTFYWNLRRFIPTCPRLHPPPSASWS